MQRQDFNHDWQFRLGDPTAWRWWGGNDADWRPIDLPHDWSIELDRSPANPSGATGGYFTAGIGWYQKSFSVPEAWRGKKTYVEFEGVYMNAETWLNGHFLGRHPYGYTSFAYDLTPYLKFGTDENLLHIVVDNASQRNSRWYSGSGIYRPAWLWVADPVHVAHWGVYVTTPEVSTQAATVRACTKVENRSDRAAEAVVRSKVIAPDGSVAAVSQTTAAIDPARESTVEQELHVSAPQLWSTGSPHLYRLETELLVGEKIVDTAITPFGIRSIRFDAENGFLLNDEPQLIKGGCVHHDNGVLGAASYSRSEERKVELLKASGYNAIRCAHNPPAPSFLDCCDRLGMLVIDEAFDCWRDGKTFYDYHVAFDDWWQRDLDSMLYRDRNHPSIIMWSIGNEVRERAGQSGGYQIARMLADHVRSVDPTRPVTAAINGSRDEWPWEQTDETFAALDVGGYNYRQPQYKPDHERLPERVMYGAESTAREAFEHWMDVLEMNCVIGDFVWTSLDYLGESGIGRVELDEIKSFLGEYPWHQAYCGDIDLCGFKRPQSYYRDVLWGSGDPLYIAVHYPVPEGKTAQVTYWGWPDVDANWTWPGRDGETFQVDVYSACQEVELFLNGRSLGRKPSTREERFIATFEVPYAPGTLKAIAYQGAEAVAEHQLKTASAAAGIRLTPDRSTLQADPGDLGFVTVEIVDADGALDPNANHTVFFTVKGPGVVAAVGNGNPVSPEPYRGNQRRAHRGRCLVVVKTKGEAGEIILRAQADGLDGAEITMQIA